jgi:hypothetical protein
MMGLYVSLDELLLACNLRDLAAVTVFLDLSSLGASARGSGAGRAHAGSWESDAVRNPVPIPFALATDDHPSGDGLDVW